ncbi:hypothetical protein [Raineya sp.]|jgi:hypothetical protein
MEQLYWWSLVTLLWSGWQVIRQVVRLEAHKLAQFKRIVAYQVLYFLRNEYKLAFVILISALVLLATGSAVRDNVLQTFFWLNVAWWFLQVFVKELLQYRILSQKIHFFSLFWEGSPLSVAGMAGALLLNTFLLHFYQGFFGNVVLLLALLSAVFLGLGIVFLALRFWQYRLGLHPAPLQNPHISNERLDLWIVVLLGSLILSQMYGNRWVFTIIPLLITFITLLSAILMKHHSRWQMVIVFLQIVLIGLVSYIFLPNFWLKNGVSYYRTDLLITLLFSTLIAIFSDKVISFYKFLQEKYTSFFVEKPVFHLWLTYFLRGSITFTITALVAWGIIFAFQKVELYGMSLALLVILSNIQAQISFDIPAKWQ